MKKPTKIIAISIPLIIILYLLVAFLTRDLGRGWCELSFGEYQPIINCMRCNGDLFDNCCTKGPEQVCTRGLFNSSSPSRHLKIPKPMSIN